MNSDKGLISSTMDWLSHPYYSGGSVLDYTAALVLIFIVSFLWATVVRSIE